MDYIFSNAGFDDAQALIQSMQRRLGELSGQPSQRRINTPYKNTISPEDEPDYPGDIDLETKIRSFVQWNAMAMVVTANRNHDGLGGHISTFASSAVLYEVGFNHFLEEMMVNLKGDQIFFQGHASPGIYARAYLENRIGCEEAT